MVFPMRRTRCRHARYRSCNQYDRESEFPESAGRLGGGEGRHWEALGLKGRCSRWKQENHRREKQATRNCYQRVASARTLRGGQPQERYLQVQWIRTRLLSIEDSSGVPQVWPLRSEGSGTSYNGFSENFLGDGTILRNGCQNSVPTCMNRSSAGFRARVSSGPSGRRPNGRLC